MKSNSRWRDQEVVANFPCVLGVDDLWFDAARKRIYATGAGSIGVFRLVDPEHYTAIGSVPVGLGSGGTSLHLKTRPKTAYLCHGWPRF
jgi:hypothetical protein